MFVVITPKWCGPRPINWGVLLLFASKYLVAYKASIDRLKFYEYILEISFLLVETFSLFGIKSLLSLKK